MLKIIKNNNIKKSKIVLSQPKKGKEIEITRHFPPITKYWLNSIYSYNKNTIKSIPLLNNIVNNIIKYYFNLKLNINLSKKLIGRRIKKIRLSTTKIFVSRAEIKHSNDKVIINLYTYNRRKNFYIKKLKELYNNFFASSFNFTENYNNSTKLLEKLNSNNLLKILKNKERDYSFLKEKNSWEKENEQYNNLYLHEFFINNIINESKYNLNYLKYRDIYEKKHLFFDNTIIRSDILLNIIKKWGIYNRKKIEKTKYMVLKKIKSKKLYMESSNYFYNFLIKDALKKEKK